MGQSSSNVETQGKNIIFPISGDLAANLKAGGGWVEMGGGGEEQGQQAPAVGIRRLPKSVLLEKNID